MLEIYTLYKMMLIVFFTGCYKSSLKLLEPFYAKKEIVRLDDRLTVTGDFDGDGKLDTLLERYINKRTKKEINKIDFNKCGSVECVKEFIEKYDPGCYVKWIGEHRSILLSYKEGSYPSNGIFGMVNLGNINETKGDELAILEGPLREMGLTDDCLILSFNGKKWELFKSFGVHNDHYWDYKKQKVIMVKAKRPNWKNGNFFFSEKTNLGIFYLGSKFVYYYGYGDEGEVKEFKIQKKLSE